MKKILLTLAIFSAAMFGSKAVAQVTINEAQSNGPGDDFIELYNAGTSDVDLEGYILQDDGGAEKEFTFPTGSIIKAKSVIVMYSKAENSFQFGLSKKGDKVILLDSNREIIDQVDLPKMDSGQSYARTTDGTGEWTLGTPTPGEKNNTTIEEPEVEKSSYVLYINEVMSNPADDTENDWIEIFNPYKEEVDISGFILQDDKGEAEQFVMPEGTKIAARGVILFSQVSPSEGPSFTFGLSSKGEKVVLLDKEGKKIDEVDIPKMKDDNEGATYARKTDGGDKWEIRKGDEITKGASNGAYVGEDISLGINSVKTDRAAGNGIYTIDGRYIGNDITKLQRGLYIVNGKKIFKK
ncbi:MAG: lamin tail domain-containing protein [Prevotella sp.]|jgi:hypothetical protein